MKYIGIELRRLSLPLVAPFRTSFGTQTRRDVLVIRTVASDAEGWAECGALSEPTYSSEYVDATIDVLRRFLIPAIASQPTISPQDVAPTLSRFRGHRMAKSAIETAILDADLRATGVPLARALGGTRDHVRCGVSVGIMDSIPALIDVVSDYLELGYMRIKLKIEPGWDMEPVRAVRERFGNDLMLQVDANAAYEIHDAQHLAKLDDFGLLMIEQPLDEGDLVHHAKLADQILTPICLDESITSARDAANAIELGACKVINIKPARVGGYLEARRIHDVCAAHGVPVWCGGMLETGIGRAANLALAALPGFVYPGDTSASDRYYTTDITAPFVLKDGTLDVPTGPGIGVDPIPEVLASTTESVEWIPFSV